MRSILRKSAGLAGLTCVLLGAVGCGREKTATVSGSVSFEGKPVVRGSVSFAGLGKDRLPRSGFIDKDGTYTVVGVPVGEAQVAVLSVDPDSGNVPWRSTRKDARIGSVDNSGWFPIPGEYGNLAKSGLTVTIDERNVVHNIELKSKETTSQ